MEEIRLTLSERRKVDLGEHGRTNRPARTLTLPPRQLPIPDVSLELIIQSEFDSRMLNSWDDDEWLLDTDGFDDSSIR
jgi:hypothetical protein